MILPVDLSARVLPRQRFLLLDQLRTTLASVLHVSILRKNLQKPEWRRCGRSRSNAQVSDGITKYSERISKLKEPCAVNLSVLKSILKCSQKAYLKSLLRVPYIPERFSLLTVTPLDTWLTSNCTRVTVWIPFHLSVTSTLQAIRLSYPCKE